MSMIASSGRSLRTSPTSSAASLDWPTTSKPFRSSRPASPSRSNTSSSASTTRGALVLMRTIMGYREDVATRPRTVRDQLGEEQAALRRVATLMAEGASSSEVFDAVALEVTRVLQLPNAAVARFDDAGTSMTILAARDDRSHPFQPGTTWPLDGPSMSVQILRTGKPARIEDYSEVPGTI